MPQNNAIISIKTDSYSPINEALINRDIAEKFSFSITNLASKKEEFSKFVEKLKQKYTLIESMFEFSIDNISYIIEEANDKFKIFANCTTFQGDYDNVGIYTVDTKTGEEIFKDIKPYLDVYDSELSIELHEYYLANNTIQTNTIYIPHKDLEQYREEYYPYLNLDYLFSQYLVSSSPILFLSGEKGTGKTKLSNMFMKFLLKTDMNQIIKDEEENTILGFKVVNPEILTRDDFWVRIKRERYQFGILDEMDKILVSRQDETTDSISRDRFVNEFLTYTDGNQKTKTKVIVSTNLDLQQVDKAIIRNGRTFDVLRLKNLTREQALNIWTQYGLEVEEFEKTFKGKTHINPSEIGAKIEFIQNANKANIVAQKYCLEEGVSMISSIIQNNKLSI